MCCLVDGGAEKAGLQGPGVEQMYRKEQREETVLAASHLVPASRSVVRFCCIPDLGLQLLEFPRNSQFLLMLTLIGLHFLVTQRVLTYELFSFLLQIPVHKTSPFSLSCIKNN